MTDPAIGVDDHRCGPHDSGRDADGPRSDGSGFRADGGDVASADTAAIVDELFAVIEDRRETLPEDSYTASLLDHDRGIDAVLEKLGEETTELVLAAKDGDDDEVAHEAADVVYHLLVLLAARDMGIEDLRAELAERRG